MSDKYAMYLRKSRADIELESIEKMETLKRHKKILSELARKQHLNVVAIYEEVVSGESIADRPEMQKLLNDVFQKKYKGVLVVEVERLARGDTKDQGEVAEAFKYSNTLIVTPTKTYDPHNQFDEEYFEFGLFMSRREYKTIQRRLQTGKLMSIKEGNYMGSLPPYGYDIVTPARKVRTLEPNDQAQYVKMMFDWFVNDNMSCGEIARKLSSMGITTLTGKSEWNRATVKDILQNNLYTGKVRWNRRKCSKEYDEGKMSKKKRRLASDGYLIAEGKHPAIISQEVFDKAQTKFTGQVPVNANVKVVNPLSRLLFCKHCGKAISYQSFAHKKNTTPRFTHRESMSCKVKSMPANEVIEALIKSLQEVVNDYELKVSNHEEQKSNKDVIESLEKELASCSVRKDELMEYFERKIYSLEEFVERREKLNARIDSIKQQLEVEKSQNNKTIDYQAKIITYKKAIETLKDETIDAKKKNDFLKEIIDHIDYECEDLGRQKGGNVTLGVYLR